MWAPRRLESSLTARKRMTRLTFVYGEIRPNAMSESVSEVQPIAIPLSA
jgi:hypothetical protein